jgi:hypothetical protein
MFDRRIAAFSRNADGTHPSGESIQDRRARFALLSVVVLWMRSHTASSRSLLWIAKLRGKIN